MHHRLVRHISTTSKILKNYYEVLEVSPQATQAQIKAAYYKLSLIYHPDRNEGNSTKFHAISAAYEVLGNYNSRQLYDKGLSTIYEGTPNTTSTSSNGKHHMPTTTGRTVVYNFDQWTRAHYGETFERRNSAKKRFDDSQKAKDISKEMDTIQHTILGLFFVFCLFGLISYNQENLDEPVKNNVSKQSSKP